MGLTYVYIGQGQGLVGAGAQELFTRKELIANPNLEEVYHQDRVSIFAIKSQACQAAHK
jgi:hypothetical protein